MRKDDFQPTHFHLHIYLSGQFSAFFWFADFLLKTLRLRRVPGCLPHLRSKWMLTWSSTIATVTDPNSNRLVTGLEKEHFKVFEDKVEQRISQFSTEDMPVSIGLLFDVSSSMGEKIGGAKDAAIAFLKMTNPDDEYFLLTFADQPKMLEEFTSDFNEIQNRLAFAHAKGSTTLYDAVYLGLEKMKHGHNPKKAILLITDGEDTRSRYSLLNVRNAVKESDTQIFAIGIVDSY